MTDRDEDPYLDTEKVSERAGVAAETIRIYLKRSRKRVAEDGELRPQDLPLPDMTIGRSPAWKRSTVDAWMTNRVGRGRPKSDSA